MLVSTVLDLSVGWVGVERGGWFVDWWAGDWDTPESFCSVFGSGISFARFYSVLISSRIYLDQLSYSQPQTRTFVHTEQLFQLDMVHIRDVVLAS